MATTPEQEQAAFRSSQQRVAEALRNVDSKANGSPSNALRACEVAEKVFKEEERERNGLPPHLRNAHGTFLKGARDHVAQVRQHALYHALRAKFSAALNTGSLEGANVSSLKSAINGYSKFAPESEIVAAIKWVFEEAIGQIRDEKGDFMKRVQLFNKTKSKIRDLFRLLDEASRPQSAH